MQATVRITVVSEVKITCADPGEFLQKINRIQQMALPDPHQASGPATGVLSLKTGDFEWKDEAAVVHSVEAKIGK